MKTRWWLNAALLAVVAALAAWAWLKPQSDDGDSKFKLTTLTTAQVSHIKIEMGADPAIELERTTSGWRLTAPLQAGADSVQVQRLLSVLEASAQQRWPATGLARYELDPPHARLTIDQQAFSFGAYNDMSREQYLQTQDSVYLVSPRYGATLPKDVLQLVGKQLFADDEIPVAYETTDFKLTQQDGRWLLAPAANAGTEDIQRWIDGWQHAYALAVVPAPGGTPLQTIKMTLRNGSALRIDVLQREPDFILKRSDQSYALQFSDAVKFLLAPPAPETRK